MFDKRLLALVPQGRQFVVASVALRWLALIAQTALYFLLATALGKTLDGMTIDFVMLVAECLACVALCFALSALGRWFASRASACVQATVSQAIFDKVVRLGGTRRRFVSDSDVSQLMGEGVELLKPYFSQYLPQFFFAVLAPLTLFVVLVPVNVPAAAVLLMCVPLMPGAIMMLMKRAKRYMGDYWGSFVDLGGAFLDAVKGLTTLKVFGSDADEQARLQKQAEDFRKITMKLLKVQLGSVIFMDLFTYGGIAAGVLVALAQVALGTLGVTDALVVVLLSSSFFMPMRSFGSQFHTGMNAGPVINQLFVLLEAPEPALGSASVDAEQVTIKVCDMSYSYGRGKDGASDALQGINLEIRPNSYIGLAGPSGGGKSTLAGVLSGDLVGYTGSITANGVELSDMSREALSNLVTVVSQDSHVFQGSFRGNLQMARPDATDPAMWEALRQAKLDEFVLECGGLDALVMGEGANLSGGQRQRLCFARALLRNTPVYIFDEATSNMDAQSEQLMMAAIQNIALRKTVIVASHRLKQMVYADEILVMEDGVVAEQGTHVELMKHQGTYRDMWDKTAELESFAQQVVEELPPDEPSAIDAAIAKMPGMMADVMTAFVSIMKSERYNGVGTSAMPDGHPAWIPLPNYKPGMSREDADAVADADSTPAAQTSFFGIDGPKSDDAIGQDASKGMGGFMDATLGALEDEEAEEIRQAMVSLKDSLGMTPQVKVHVQAPPPAKRPALRIVRDLISLTRDAVPELALAAILGGMGWLCTAGTLAFGASGVLSVAGLSAPLGFGASIVCAILCAVLRGLLHYAERLLTHDQTFKTLELIRGKVFEQLRQLAPAKLESRESGDLIALLTSDIDLLEGFYSRACAPVLAVALALVIFFIVLACIRWQLALWAAVSYLLIAVIVPIVSTRITRERGAELRAYAVTMTGFLLDSLAGLDDLLHFGRAKEYADELGEHLGSLTSGEDGFSKRTALLAAIPQAFAAVALTGMVVIVGGLCASATMSPVLGAIACVLFMASLDAAISVASLGFSLHQTLASADRVLDILEEEPAITDAQDATAIDGFEGLLVDGVSFGFDGIKVLEDISMQIDPGTFVGITGKSGVGKSTLLKLLMRFWDVESGQVCINGIDVRDIRLDSLRGMQSYMTQDTYLFQGTLKRNLLVACPDASDEQIRAAIERAALDDVAARLPQGVDTYLGAGGEGLSCGERQRVGLARAFLHDAPLMLLDEPTSNLDALNEAAILRALCLGAQDKTVIIVSHRKAVAAIVDKLLVIESDRES